MKETTPIDMPFILFFAGGFFFTFLLGNILLWKKTEKNLPQKILMVAGWVWILFIFWFTVSFYRGQFPFHSFLDVRLIMWGIITGYAIVSYPIVTLCPLQLRNRILTAITMISVFFLLLSVMVGLFSNTGWEYYSPVSWFNTQGPDVNLIIRIILFLIPVGYNLIVIWLIISILPVYERYIRNTYADLDYNLHWLRIAAAFFTGITIVYAINVIWYDWWTRILFILVDFPLWILLLNQAIFAKFFTPPDEFSISWKWKTGWHETLYSKQEDEVVPLVVELLSRKLESYMLNPDAFTNANLTREEFARNLNTNRTTLALAIRQCGFDNFQDYINRHRVNHFKTLASRSPQSSIVTLYTQAGFGSKSTFYRYFKECEGLLPGDFMKKMTMEFENAKKD